MKITQYKCDKCKLIFEEDYMVTVRGVVDTKRDPALGEKDPIYEEADLCVTCLGEIVQNTLNKCTHEEVRAFMHKNRRNTDPWR